MIDTGWHISTASLSEQADIEAMVRQFNLDDADIHDSQFYVCRTGEGLQGVGRIRKHLDCIELCSLAVAETHRGKGIGQALVNALLNELLEAVYLVTEIPAYFEKLGFVRTDDSIPSAVAEKQKVCKEQLCRSQAVVMVKNMKE